MFQVSPQGISGPLHLCLTDPARGKAEAINAGEEEPAVNLADVLDHQLLLGFHLKLWTELAAPAEQVSGQEDGGGNVGLLSHPVGLQ